ncbi:MAG: helix-turn-helix domain-containing protein [bacterium]
MLINILIKKWFKKWANKVNKCNQNLLDSSKNIREKTHLSLTVFAALLNVSPTSVRQWEQAKRVQTGAKTVLLELLDQSPHLLDYRIAV